MEETSVHTDLGGATSAFGGNQGLLLTTSERLLRDTASPHKVGGDVGGCVDVCLSVWGEGLKDHLLGPGQGEAS